MDFTTFIIASLLVVLFACMTADVILDLQGIWASQFERSSGRLEIVEKEDAPEKQRPIIADLSWVSLVEDEQPEVEVDIIALAKSRQKSRPVIQAGVKVRELLDGLGKQVQHLVDYSSMNIRQLKALASQFKIKGYGKIKKAELVLALQNVS